MRAAMTTPAPSQPRFAGIDRLYGASSVDRLARRHVCIVGIGGVGSWAVEALARSGVGRLTLIDADDICVSNTNRQVHAIEGQYGRSKVQAMAERARAINPAIQVEALAQFLTTSNLAQMLHRDYDFVLDACDTFRVKVEAVAFCRRNKIPMITVGSAGGRTDSTLVQVRDLSRTEHDAMLALVRKRLRAEFNFPRTAKRFFGVQAVYSLENVKFLHPDGRVCGVRPETGPDAALKLDCGTGLGAAAHVTAAFAFAAVSRMLPKLAAHTPRDDPAPPRGA